MKFHDNLPIVIRDNYEYDERSNKRYYRNSLCDFACPLCGEWNRASAFIKDGKTKLTPKINCRKCGIFYKAPEDQDVVEKEVVVKD